MFCYIPLLKNYVPSCLSAFLKDMQYSWGKLEDTQWIHWIFGLNTGYDDGTTPYRFKRAGLTTSNFLLNGGELMFIVVACWMSVPIVGTLRIWFHKNEDVYWYESRWRWEMTVKSFLLGYMHLMITSILNVQNYRFENILEQLSYVLSWIMIVLNLCGYAAIIGITVWYKLMPKWQKEEWIFN